MQKRLQPNYFNLKNKKMYLLSVCVLVLGLMGESIRCEKEPKRAWILVADPIQNYPWWMRDMQMKGDQSVWEFKQTSSQKILKLKLFESKQSSKHVEMTVFLNMSEEFDVETYESDINATFQFFIGGKLVKYWKSDSVNLNLIISKGEITLTGQGFYFWIQLEEKYQINYVIISIITAFLIIKTQIVYSIKGHFWGPELIIPGILIYFLVLTKGVVLSVKDIMFQSPWQYGEYTAYSLVFYIWLPYAVRIFQLFYRATLFKSPNKIWRAVLLGGLGSIMSVVGIFWQINEISILIVFAIKLALPSSQETKTKQSYVIFGLYALQVLLLIYLCVFPIYPSRHLLSSTSWLFACLLMIFFELLSFILRKDKKVTIRSEEESPKKRKRKSEKSE